MYSMKVTPFDRPYKGVLTSELTIFFHLVCRSTQNQDRSAQKKEMNGIFIKEKGNRNDDNSRRIRENVKGVE